MDRQVSCIIAVISDFAERMARRRVRLYGGEPVVSAFEFDEAAAKADGLSDSSPS